MKTIIEFRPKEPKHFRYMAHHEDFVDQMNSVHGLGPTSMEAMRALYQRHKCMLCDREAFQASMVHCHLGNVEGYVCDQHRLGVHINYCGSVKCVSGVQKRCHLQHGHKGPHVTSNRLALGSGEVVTLSAWRNIPYEILRILRQAGGFDATNPAHDHSFDRLSDLDILHKVADYLLPSEQLSTFEELMRMAADLGIVKKK